MFTDILSIYVLVNGCSGNTTRKYKSFCSPRTTHHDSPGKLLNGFNFKSDEVELSLILLGTKCNLRLIQVCIPVGCVPPASVAAGGVSVLFHRHPRSQRHPPQRPSFHRDLLSQRPLHRDLPFTQRPPSQRPLDRDPLDRDNPGQSLPPDREPPWKETPQKEHGTRHRDPPPQTE